MFWIQDLVATCVLLAVAAWMYEIQGTDTWWTFDTRSDVWHKIRDLIQDQRFDTWSHIWYKIRDLIQDQRFDTWSHIWYKIRDLIQDHTFDTWADLNTKHDQTLTQKLVSYALSTLGVNLELLDAMEHSQSLDTLLLKAAWRRPHKYQNRNYSRLRCCLLASGLRTSHNSHKLFDFHYQLV